MISISLLPPEFRRLTQLRTRFRMLILGGIVLGLILALALGFVFLNGKIAQHQLEKTLDYRGVLEERLVSLSAYDEPYRELRGLNEIIDDILKEQTNWKDILSQVGSITPQGVWLTDFRGFTSSPKDRDEYLGQLVIKGGALDQMLLSRFLGELNSLSDLTDVKCHFASTETRGRVATQFEITAHISLPEKPPHKEQGDSS